jgi:hypothetical protein
LSSGTMTRIDDRYEGDFLKSDDLPEGVAVNVVIESVADPDTEKDAAGKVIKKAIVKFAGKHKRLILGKTSYRVLKTMLGADPEKWIGQPIQIQRRYLPAERAFGVKNEMCIRVVPPEGTPLPKTVRECMGFKHPISD